MKFRPYIDCMTTDDMETFYPSRFMGNASSSYDSKDESGWVSKDARKICGFPRPPNGDVICFSKHPTNKDKRNDCKQKYADLQRGYDACVEKVRQQNLAGESSEPEPEPIIEDVPVATTPNKPKQILRPIPMSLELNKVKEQKQLRDEGVAPEEKSMTPVQKDNIKRIIKWVLILVAIAIIIYFVKKKYWK